MTLYQRFLRKPEFGSYEDFLHNFRINVPENFNFAYDVLDVIAEEEPDKRALQWAHMDGRERAFTFAEISRLSKQAANLFVRLGIQKGDKVMLVLRRHYTFWIAIMALCRIGAVAVPATHLLTKKDIVYRANCAGIKMVVTSAEGCFAASCEEAMPDCPTVEKLLIVDGAREGWLDFEGCLLRSPTSSPARRSRSSTTTSCFCTSPPARPACPRWSATISTTPWGISRRRCSGISASTAACISPSRRPAG